MNKAEQIKQLHREGWSNRDIAKQLGCSDSTVWYHLCPDKKQHNRERRKKYFNKNPEYRARCLILNKIDRFCKTDLSEDLFTLLYNKISHFREGKTMTDDSRFTPEDILAKFGEKTQCYLTGEPIDMLQPNTYQFDHIIPRSRGGSNSIDNLGICSKRINQAKCDMTPEEFIELCKKVLIYQGYEIKATEKGTFPIGENTQPA